MHLDQSQVSACCKSDVCRLKTSFKTQCAMLEKSRAMQDEMADALLSLKVNLPSLHHICVGQGTNHASRGCKHPLDFPFNDMKLVQYSKSVRRRGASWALPQSALPC